MPHATPHDNDGGLSDLLKLFSACVQADGLLIAGARADGDPRVVASLPAGIAGRPLPLSSALGAVHGQGIQPTGNVLLPSVMTGWLGFRPAFVASLPVPSADATLTLFAWWKERPAESATLLAHLELAARLAGSYAGRESTSVTLQRMQDRLEAMLGNVSLGIVFVDFLHGSQLNPVAAALLGIPASTRETAAVIAAMQVTRSACRVETAEDSAPELTSIASHAEYWISRERNLVLRVESHPVGSAQAPGRFWVFTDVKPLWDSSEKLKSANNVMERNLVQLTEQVERRLEAEAELRRYNQGLKQQNEELEIAKLESDLLANQDALTGLANRRRFRHGLEELIEEAQRKSSRVAILYLDLDKFKPVNDRLGHERGDQLLRAVADTLVGVLRKDDLIARLGGDEFACALPLPPSTSSSEVGMLVSQLSERLSIPVESPAGIIHVTSTIGVALYPDDAEDATSLLRAADNAMYLGKNKGGNEVVTFARSQSGLPK